MTWPQVPTCHEGVRRFGDVPFAFAKQSRRDGEDEDFQRCTYCGSLRAQDLVRLVDAGVALKFGGADWKYGWPHKFYVEGLPNLTPGLEQEFAYSWRDGVKVDVRTRPSPPTLTAKFYNAHLLDAGYAEAELRRLLDILRDHGGIEFNIEPGQRLHYRVLPHYVG